MKRRVLLAAIIGSGIVFLDSSLTNVALPAIQRDLDISITTQQWVASAYLLTLSTLLLVTGRLADLFGRRLMFVVGLYAYATLSVGAAIAPNGWVLVGVRAVQGAAGAVLVPTTLALINSVYPPGERGRAIGTWAAWSGITSILGPVLGGLAIDNLSWRSAFLITPALSAVALVLSKGVPESRDLGAERDIDVIGAGLAILSLGGVVFALIQGPMAGWSDPLVMASAVLGVLMMPLFIWRERRARSPVLPFKMFSSRNLVVANITTLFVYAGVYGMFFYVAIYIQSALGASATVAGAVFIPVTLTLFVLSPIAGRLNDRYGPRWLMTGGPLVAAIGLVVMGAAGDGELYSVLLPGIVVFGIGLGFTVAPLTATAIGSADERYSGVASGFNNSVSRIAGLLAIALMGIIIVQLWQGALGEAELQASPGVVVALRQVSEHALVLPETSGMPAEEARDARARALRAAEDAYWSGMLLIAALVAFGGVVSGVAMVRPVVPDSG